MASTSSLSRQYGSLTASERAALSILAIARDNDAVPGSFHDGR